MRAAILPRGRQGYAVPRVARVSPGCRARQRVWPRTLAKIRAHGRGWVKTGHFAGFACTGAGGSREPARLLTPQPRPREAGKWPQTPCRYLPPRRLPNPPPSHSPTSTSRRPLSLCPACARPRPLPAPITAGAVPPSEKNSSRTGGRERVIRPVGEGDSRWHVHRGMFTYAATRVGAYTRPMRGRVCHAVRGCECSRLCMLAKIGGCTCGREYRYTRLHVWPRILAKIRAHGRGWVKTGHFAGFAATGPVPIAIFRQSLVVYF